MLYGLSRYLTARPRAPLLAPPRRPLPHQIDLWSVAVLNLVLLGAVFSTLSRLGNEPLYTCSFSSGLAIRVLLNSDWVGGCSLLLSSGLGSPFAC